MHHDLHTEITIDAPPDTVWQVLSDLDRYADWNPFITSAAGDLAVGKRLTNRLQPPGGKAMTFKPTITEIIPGQSLEWLGRLGIAGVFDGRHRFELTGTPDGGTRMVHSEHFSGVLVPFLRRSLDKQTKQGFEEMNASLKAQAESHARDES